MNETHLKWARSHDWGRKSYLDNGFLVIPNETVFNPKTGQEESLGPVKFTAFSQLKEWAGY